MNFPPDLIEEQISDSDQAWDLLNNKLPQFKNIFSLWQAWFEGVVKDKQMYKVVVDALVISYARMALRNGSLGFDPRAYHNEGHIDDLLYRLIAVSQLQSSENIPSYGWSLLSLFMCGHDLRQSENNEKSSLIGNNEQASYQEIERLLVKIDKQEVFRREHKELLKTMIHGSTFGKGADTFGNIYQGNLVRYLLKKIKYFEEVDSELAYLACDIDTANVAADLSDYAQSSIDVYNEVQNISQKSISAKEFFGEQQQQYFFELQKFNSKIGVVAFGEQKSINAPKIQKICNTIKALDDEMPGKEVIATYLNQVQKYS